MFFKNLQLRLAACLLLLFTGFIPKAQKLTDTVSKPVFKNLDIIEVNPRENTSYIKMVSATATKTSAPVMDIPQSISTVTRQLMDDRMDFSLKESVTELANVNAYSGYDEYSIRGFRAENPRQINGLRGYNSRYNSILLLNIESIDVIKGPAAVLYGNTDPGGTVNLTTKKPLGLPAAHVAVFGGSWNHFRAQGDITGPLDQSKKFLYRLNAGYDHTNGFTDQFYSNAYQIAPSFAIIPNKNIQFNLDFSYSHINTMLNRGQPGLDKNNNLYATPISLSLSQPGDYLKETDFSSMISFDWKINPRLGFHTAYLNYLTQQNVAEHGLNSYVNTDSVNLYFQTWDFNTNTQSWTNYFKYAFNLGETRHEALIGYDYISTQGSIEQIHYENPNNYPSGSGIVGGFNLLHPHYSSGYPVHYQFSTYQNGNLVADNYSTQGIYFQDQISYKKWNLLLGIRKEFYRAGRDESPIDSSATVDNVWLPRVGLVYDISPRLHAYGLYSQGFDPYEITNMAQVFNEPFKPVKSELFELGLKATFLKGKLYGTISFYQLSIFNVTVYANDPSNPDLYMQRGEDQARGVETELNGNIFPYFQVHIAYAYNLAKVKESTVNSDIGMIKENAPVNSSNGFFKYDFSKGFIKGFSLIGGYDLIGKRNTLDKNIVLPSYFTMQGGLNFHWKTLGLSMLVNNIGKVVYWNGAYNNIYKWPGAPRNMLVKMSWDLYWHNEQKK